MDQVLTKPVTLIERLQKPELFDHPVSEFKVIETHISLVLLTGQYAYKIKKPVNFGFLDFSTLKKRQHYCQEEIRLNRRLASDLYLSVITITGSNEEPELNGQGPAIEYAVKMLQFPQSAQLDRILLSKGLDTSIIDKLSKKVARFHLSLKDQIFDNKYGNFSNVKQPVVENFQHIRSSIKANLLESDVPESLDKIEHWTQQQLQKLHNSIKQRKEHGYVRECHGDMHLRNIALWNDEIIIFDCIEFNENFYWIDVISEVAFLIMDLEDRNQTALAQRFLNQYLEITGDYVGLTLLQFYKVYRAMVRAKVAALRLNQENSNSKEYEQIFTEFRQYLALAERYIIQTEPILLINHGLSGSGKTYGAKTILEHFPAILVRSDIERKRLFKENIQNGEPILEQGIYTPEATKQTYLHLVEIAQSVIRSGLSVVIDAANLKQHQRQLFIDLANSLNVPYFILDFHAPEATLQQRILKRRQRGNDASDATLDVLRHQISSNEPLTPDEAQFAIKMNTEQAIEFAAILDQIHTSPPG